MVLPVCAYIDRSICDQNVKAHSSDCSNKVCSVNFVKYEHSRAVCANADDPKSLCPKYVCNPYFP